MIIIEGPRNVGKSYLTKYASAQLHWPIYKMSFATFFENFHPNKREALGFGYGKDIQILNMMLHDMIPKNIFMDRGFLSSAVYSVMNHRCSLKKAKEYIKFIMEKYYAHLSEENPMILVRADHAFGEREKDRWDKMNFEKQMDLYSELSCLVSHFTFLNNYGNEMPEHFTRTIKWIRGVE